MYRRPTKRKVVGKGPEVDGSRIRFLVTFPFYLSVSSVILLPLSPFFVLYLFDVRLINRPHFTRESL